MSSFVSGVIEKRQRRLSAALLIADKNGLGRDLLLLRRALLLSAQLMENNEVGTKVQINSGEIKKLCIQHHGQSFASGIMDLRGATLLKKLNALTLECARKTSNAAR
jgi:hypothetical protein